MRAVDAYGNDVDEVELHVSAPPTIAVEGTVIEVTATREAATFVVDSIYTLEDETTRTIEGLEARFFVWAKEPLVLDLGDPVGRVTALSPSPLTYVGGPNCSGWQLTSFEPWTLMVE